MNILKHDPMSFFISLLDPTLSNFILTLTEGNVEEGFTRLNSETISFLLDNLFYFFDWI